MVFDVSKPEVKVVRSPMGGGWIIPITDDGVDVLERFFDEPAYPISPLGGEIGYIVEPQDGGDLAEYLYGAGCAWVVA